MTSANRQSAILGAQPGAGGSVGEAATAARAIGDDDDAAAAGAASVSDALTRCCLCGGALLEPVPLHCLHDCCAKCLEDNLSRQQQQEQSMIVGVCTGDVRCPLCDYVSANVRSDQLNAFVAALVLAERAAAPGDGSVACDLCRESAEDEQSAGGGVGEPVPPAAFSCAECGQFLCSNCQRQHARFARGHAVTPWPPQAAAGGVQSEIASTSGGSGDSSTAAASAGRQCREHRLPEDLYCFRCKALRCAECAIGCARTAAASGAPPHETAHLDDQRCRDHIASAHRRLGNERRRLGDDLAAAAERALKLSGGGLEAARAADESALLDRKRLLLSAVEAAFATSVGALRERHDALTANAARTSQRADVTRRRAERAELYCGALLDSADAANLLLEQHDRLFAWLARLQTDAKAALAEVADVEKSCSAAAQAVAKENKPPQDLVTTLTKWFGDTSVALSAGDDPEARAARSGRIGQQQLPPPLPLQEQPVSRKQPRPVPSGSDIDLPTAAGRDVADDEERPSPLQKPSSQRPPARASPAVVRVGQPTGLFTPSSTSGGVEPTTTAARSIAFTTYGHVLVAAGREGLLEYDGLGRLVSAWRPGRCSGTASTPEPCRRWSPTMCTDDNDQDDGRGCVTLVCALEDGRAGAVVHQDCGVLLLCRHGGDASSAPAAAWTVEDGDSPPIGEGLLSAPPSAVAIYGCAIALAAPETASGKRCSRSRLVLLPLPATSAGGGRRGAAAKAYFNQTIECVVRSAALTPCAVVVAGSCGGDCVVEAYGYGGGTPLWRRELSWHVSAVCTPPSGSVVYVAAASGGSCVMALSGDDGHHLCDVVRGDRGAASVALSLRAGGGCAAALAVLSADGSCVTLRPVTGWTIC